MTCVNKSKSLQLRFIHYSCKNCNEKSCREWKTNYFVRFYLPNVTFLQYQRSALIKYFNFVFFRSTLHQFFNQSLKFCFDTSQTVWLKIENKQITKDDWGWWNLNKFEEVSFFTRSLTSLVRKYDDVQRYIRVKICWTWTFSFNFLVQSKLRQKFHETEYSQIQFTIYLKGWVRKINLWKKLLENFQTLFT